MAARHADGIRIAREDPGGADVLALLAAGEAHSASLYPAESNHHLDLDGLRAENVRFFVARGDVAANSKPEAAARNEPGRSGTPLATAAIVLHDGWAEIKRMWVEPEARGRGLSRRLLAVLEAEAADHGIALLRLETGIASLEALGLYRAAGFVECPPFAGYRPDPLSLFMEKRLDARADRARSPRAPT
ncbi:GNAT family N-acetyltransferase [Prosthecodimorpha staleyi]|uniref:GNAT family N-acetyltransferase n=1 Tax=Prosthecodimorpha staleyi TaxID=2840188 RepID=A0A947D6J1_9HYPH|nr:GNAT family N-acetyltransferase [Prosthecodimorpha staleyi]MBT9291990.1 GNAT family N-acetyltransferase [Prosthecodimorpha staleyi]